MSKFKVDSEQINTTVETLKKLLAECEEIYEKKVPTSDVDKGQTHEELIVVCDNIRTTCYYFGQLISNTIEFLGKSSEMFEQSDTTSADAIKDDGGTTTHTSSSGNTHGGDGASFGGAEDNQGSSSEETNNQFNKKVEQLKVKEGFRQGDEWGPNDSYGSTWGCCAKAYQMQESVTGSIGNYMKITDSAEIQVGDVLHYWTGESQHYVFVTAINGKTLSVGEGNYDVSGVGSGPFIVNYRTMDMSSFDNGNLWGIVR